MRAFIALEIPPEIKAPLDTFLLRLGGMPSAEKVRWVKTRGMHLTLKFLGDIKPESIPVIAAGLQAAVQDQPALELELGRLGVFPGLSKPRVLWIGIGGELPGLIRLQSRIEYELRERGFEKDSRDYHPHLTLGRVRQDAGKADLEQVAALVSIDPPESPRFISREVVLFESVLKPEGAVYTSRAKAALGGVA